MKILVIREIYVTQVSILIFSHDFNVLIERIIQSKCYRVHGTPVNTRRIGVVYNFSVRVELVITNQENVPVSNIC